MKKLVIILTLLVTSQLVWAAGITFTFANATITGTTPKYYEFDVMVQADAAGTRLGDNQVYINYNSLGFGTRIVQNGKLGVTKGTLLSGDISGSALYNLLPNQDNSDSRIAVSVEFAWPVYNFGNEVPTTATQLLHFQIEIADANQTAGLSFEQSLMIGQQYEADNSTVFDPVIASDTDDSSLPVELSNFSVNFVNSQVYLSWTTESELDNLGFEIMRSVEQKRNFYTISSYKNNEDLKGSGNSSSQKTYTFFDNTISSAGTYWYKLVDTDYAGVKTTHPPISVNITSNELLSITGEFPKEFKLHQNYPNPFNPSTKISFDIPDQVNGADKANIIIFNSLGMVVKKLYSGNIAPGRFQLTWDGTSDNGVALPTGIYFTRLYLKNYTHTIKMTLLK